MKPKLKLETLAGSGRPHPLTAALRAQAAAAKRRKERLTLWRIGLIGGSVIAAALVCLEALKTPTKNPQNILVAVRLERPSSGTVKAAPKPPADPASHDTPPPSPKKVETPLPAPTIQENPESAAQKPTETELMNAEADILMVGMDSQRDAAINRDRELLERVIYGKAWDAYRALLARSIKTGLAALPQGPGLNRFDPLWDQVVIYQALLRWKTLGCFSESQISSLISDRYTGGVLTWLLNDNAAMEELLLTINSKDHGDRVLKFLIEAWSVNEAKYQKYFALTMACAVVFDEPVSIPHPVGKAEYSAESQVEPIERYLWYINQNEKGKLAAPVHHSSARDLVWVVCAPVTTSELEWALDKLHYRRKNWGAAYGEIEYLMERAVEGLNPYKEYSFAEILKEGGICGDQSNFCVNTARAQGIHAMTLSG